jgi:hypothetical protein
LIIAVGVALRLIDIDYSLDGDEVFSAVLAARSGTDLVAHALSDRTQGPLHIFMLSGWMRLFGDSEPALRMLSVLLSIGFLFVLRTLAVEQLEPWPGILLLVMGAAGSFFILNGQQARPYSLSLFLSSLSLLYFMRLIRRGWSFTAMAGWASSAALAVSASYLLVFYALSQAALLMLHFPRNAAALLLSLVICLAPLAVWMAFAFSSENAWNAGLSLIGWIAQPYFLDFGLFYVDLVGILPGVPLLWGLILILALALPALMQLRKTWPAPELRALLVLAVLPVACVFAVSYLLPASVWATRQMAGSATAAILLFAMGFNGRNPRLTRGAVLGVTAWLLVGMPSAMPKATKPPWKQVIEDYSIGEVHDAVVLHSADGWIASPVRWYIPANVLVDLQDLGSAAMPRSPIAICHPLRCGAILASAKDAGYRLVEKRQYAWSSAGLVGERRRTIDGLPMTLTTPGGLPNAWLNVLILYGDRVEPSLQ